MSTLRLDSAIHWINYHSVDSAISYPILIRWIALSNVWTTGARSSRRASSPLGKSRKVTREPHAKEDARARGGPLAHEGSPAARTCSQAKAGTICWLTNYVQYITSFFADVLHNCTRLCQDFSLRSHNEWHLIERWSTSWNRKVVVHRGFF